MQFHRNLLLLIAAVFLVIAVAVGNRVLSQEKKMRDSAIALIELRAEATDALNRGEFERASKAADGMVAQAPMDSQTMRFSGDIYLRCGKVDQAVQLFNQYIERVPEQLPYLWQRGIALAFARKYDAGAKQFESHGPVNPHDVENAAWHFLCVAKAESVEAAKKRLLAAPGDPRPPMAEILRMFESGDREGVRKRIETLGAGTPEREEADFYGELYLGLYADAIGDQTAAAHSLQRAAEIAPHHYMGDVARVYWQLIGDAGTKKTQRERE